MKDRIQLFFSYGLFWLTFFIIARICFLAYHFEQTLEMRWTDILLSMAHGLRLDLSMTGYLLLLPGLVLTATVYFRPSIVRVFFNLYTALLLIITSFIVVLDLEMYKHWGFRLDATPLLYVGEETPLSVAPGVLIFLILLWILLLGISYYTYVKLFDSRLKHLPRKTWKTSVALLLITASMITPIRGTTGVAPINTGVVFFHPNNIYANHAAINVVWNTGYALNKSKRLKYPNDLLDKEKTVTYFHELYQAQGATQKLLNTDKPNILLIVMESYTFKFIEPLGGIAGVAPNFNKMCDEGLLFTKMYASGDRTDKGIVAVLSGYPSQPLGSIIKYPKKTQNLPYLTKKLRDLGYNTSFTYGGNIDFANFRSYLSNAQFDRLTHSDHFPDNLDNSKWGVHDEYVFDKFFKEIQESEAPFFKVMLTLSSHEPFDVPMETVIEGNDDQARFLNSAHYADRSLGTFIERAKKTSWWKNTLVVITADHGHILPGNGGVSNPDRFKIPMLWLGGALEKKGETMDLYVSQTDIADTLLGQLSASSSDFLFSRDVFRDKQNDFAVYVYNNGFGYLDTSKHVVYDNTGKRFMVQSGVKNNKDLELGKAYMQTLYNDFNHR